MTEWLAVVAGTITSITIIGAFLVKVVDKIIIKPMEKRKADRAKEVELDRQKFEEKLLQSAEVNQQPLKVSIDRMNKLLEESQRDRSALHKIADVNTQKLGEHETKIHDLDDRLILVETHNNITKYREVYKGDN